MNSRSFLFWMACAGFTVAVPACAQLVSSGTNASAAPAPYTAEFRITRVQTLANGATITRETKEVMARDSQGRTLTSTQQIPTSDGQRTITSFFHVHLPDRTEINWNSLTKEAHAIHMPPPGQNPGCWSTAPLSTIPAGLPDSVAPAPNPAPPVEGGGGGSGIGGVVESTGSTGRIVSSQADGAALSQPRPASVQPVHEDLGNDTILGIEVHGQRITRTTPVGRIGNDVPLVRTTESWTAPSLGLTLRQITDDPQSGKTTREVVSLDLNEPDPSVFAPPEGYEVIDEEMHQVPCQSTH